MDQNNIGGFVDEDELNESDFSDVSSAIGMDPKEMAEKIRKLEDVAKKNSMGTSNLDQAGIRLGLQIGEKFGELKKDLLAIGKENSEMKDGMAKIMKELEGVKVEKDNEIERIKKENADGIDKMLKAFEELKEEYGRKLKEMAELIAQNGGKNAELEGKIIEKDGKIEKLKVENERLKEAMAKLKNVIDGKNVELEGKIAGLKEEEEKLKEKMAELEGKMEEMAKLTEQIGGIEWVKYDWKAFKLDAVKCGPELTISEGGFAAKHSGPNGTNTVLANLPIPSFNFSAINKPTIAFYFEVQFLKNNHYDIGIGFCTQQFPLEYRCLGYGNNSIGICNKRGILIDKTETKGNADEYFKEGDFVGLGIIHKPNSKMECFATWNGQLLGKAALPSKFLDLPLFSAVNLFVAGDSIRANFDKENCQFKEFGRVLQ